MNAGVNGIPTVDRTIPTMVAWFGCDGLLSVVPISSQTDNISSSELSSLDVANDRCFISSIRVVPGDGLGGLVGLLFGVVVGRGCARRR